MAGARYPRSLLFLGLMVSPDLGCGRTPPYASDDDTVLAIRLLPTDPVLYLKQQLQLTVEATLLRRVETSWEHEVQDITQDADLFFGTNSAGVIEIREGTILFANAAGNARLTAAYQGRQAVIDIIVCATGLIDLTGLPPDLALAVGEQTQLQVIGEMADGYRLYLTDPATGTTYTIDDAAVASVSAGGLVRGLKTGRGVIQVRHTTFQAAVEVLVGQPR